MPMGGTVVPAAFCTEIRVLTLHCKYHVYPAYVMTYIEQRCQVRDFIPRSRDFLKQLGFFWDFYLKKSISGFFWQLIKLE